MAGHCCYLLESSDLFIYNFQMDVRLECDRKAEKMLLDQSKPLS